MTAPTPRAWTAPLAAACLLAGGLLVYANAIGHPFVVDDWSAIVQHPDVTAPDGAGRLWLHDYWAGVAIDKNLYRPVTVLSHWAAWQVAGEAAWAHRLLNIALLAGVAWLTGLWLRRFVPGGVAWCMATLVLVHPVATEPINHIVGRADLLALAGVLAFLCLHARAIAAGRWTPLALAGAGLSVFVALGAKESGLVLLPLAAVQHWVLAPRVRLDADAAAPPTETDRSSTGLSVRTAVLLIAPAAIILAGRLIAVGVWVDYQFDADDLAGNPARGLGFVSRLPVAMAVLWHYLASVPLPSTLFNHTQDDLPGWSSPAAWTGLLAQLALLGGLVFTLVRRHWLAIPLTLVLGQWLIIGHLLTPTGVYAANRLALPFAVGGVMLLAAPLGGWMRREILTPGVLAVPTGIIAAIFALVVVQANGHWSDQTARMAADVEAQPDNLIAAFNYARALGEEGKPRQAAAQFERVARARPESRQAALNYAGALLVSNRLSAARKEYNRVLAEHGNEAVPEALVRLAMVALLEGKTDAAGNYLALAERAGADELDVLRQRALLAANTGELERAAELFRQLHRAQPDDAQTKKHLAAVEQLLAAQNAATPRGAAPGPPEGPTTP